MMIVRFGYVALSLSEELKGVSPNKTITVKNLVQLAKDVRVLKLQQLTKQNLHNQLRMLKYNVAYDIQLYRFTSKLVPLATHDVAKDWDYATEFAEQFQEIGEYIKKHDLRVSFHPDHFVNLNSPKDDIFASSIRDLQYHFNVSQAMRLDERMKFNIHIGGAYNDKKLALARLIIRWEQVPETLQKRITFENDDKTYTAHETLQVCKKLQVPMVLDLHHHRCNHEHPWERFGEEVDPHLVALIPDIFASWEGTNLPPKIHISSPRGTSNGSEFRSHADYIEPADLVPFLTHVKDQIDVLDVMVEAKKKDLAMRKLVSDIAVLPGFRQVNDGSLKVI